MGLNTLIRIQFFSFFLDTISLKPVQRSMERRIDSKQTNCESFESRPMLQFSAEVSDLASDPLCIDMTEVKLTRSTK